jgi:hypothetical protein
MLIDLVDIAWLIAGDNVSERRGRLGRLGCFELVLWRKNWRE